MPCHEEQQRVVVAVRDRYQFGPAIGSVDRVALLTYGWVGKKPLKRGDSVLLPPFPGERTETVGLVWADNDLASRYCGPVKKIIRKITN